MIDEIPERDPLPNKSQARPLSLTHCAILLTLVFVVLLAMFWGSRALDSLATKLWPDPTDPKIEVAVAKTGTTINIAKSSQPATNSGPVPIPLQSNQMQSNQESLTGQQNFLNQQAALKEQQSKELSSQTSAPAMPENILQPIKENSGDLAKQKNPENANANLKTLNTELKTVADNNTPNLPIANSIETSLKTASEAVKREKEQKLQQTQIASSQSRKEPLRAKEEKHYSSSEKEILNHDPRHYTVQILGMHNKNKLKSFMNETKLKGKVRCCRGNHQGKPWYILVYGEYATREEAQKVMAALPEEVKNQKPWVRSFASLQGTIHARE